MKLRIDNYVHTGPRQRRTCDAIGGYEAVLQHKTSGKRQTVQLAGKFDSRFEVQKWLDKEYPDYHTVAIVNAGD